jgi:hypothetical protein
MENSMKANQLATLVLRLMGVYCLIQIVSTIAALSSLIFTMRVAEHADFSNPNVFMPTLIPLIAWVVVAVLLFARSVPWGESLAKNFCETIITTISFDQIQALAFAVAGVMIFADGASRLLGDVYSVAISVNHFNKDQYPAGAQYYDWRLILLAFGALLKTALGLWMFFGTKGFANLWSSARNFGTPKQPEN